VTDVQPKAAAPVRGKGNELELRRLALKHANDSNLARHLVGFVRRLCEGERFQAENEN
jgi:hypothetical protein